MNIALGEGHGSNTTYEPSLPLPNLSTVRQLQEEVANSASAAKAMFMGALGLWRVSEESKKGDNDWSFLAVNQTQSCCFLPEYESTWNVILDERLARRNTFSAATAYLAKLRQLEAHTKNCSNSVTASKSSTVFLEPYLLMDEDKDDNAKAHKQSRMDPVTASASSIQHLPLLLSTLLPLPRQDFFNNTKPMVILDSESKKNEASVTRTAPCASSNNVWSGVDAVVESYRKYSRGTNASLVRWIAGCSHCVSSLQMSLRSVASFRGGSYPRSRMRSVADQPWMLSPPSWPVCPDIRQVDRCSRSSRLCRSTRT